MPQINPATIATLAKHRLIPVVSLPDASLAEPLADALVEAGLPCIEITFRTAAAEEAIRLLTNRDDLFVAAGTVLEVNQAKRAIDAGARCLLSPGTDPVVIEWCADRSVDIIPGVATPTDMLLARRLGLSTMKFFPAETMGGPSALRAIAGPMPDVRFIPTGGISAENLHDYLELPNVLACGGSWMVRPSLLEKYDFAAIRDGASQAVGLIDAMRRD
ncbi:MAG: bifunctional 4-hydroxy-2-oxoglutarate aldolase/2-dehydro-3-deoxy-phosphogluconate aldolase [Phycisphaeraceae bacterium]